MQILELHFNPKLKEEQIFDSFVYEPENVYEKKLGSLYIVGEIQNALPLNSKLLDNLSQIIKKNYYTLSINSAERALSQASKKINEFLAEQVKKENVSWLGNLSFAILCLNEKEFNLNFTKTGNIKILLLRGGEVMNIGKNLDIEEIEPYPLKIFFNVVSGKLIENDIILVLTKQVFKFLQKENLLIKIAQMNNIDTEKIKEILPSSPSISGICFLTALNKKPQENQQPILFQTKTNLFQKFIRKVNLPKLNLPGPIKKINKKIALIIGLILLLLLGFALF